MNFRTISLPGRIRQESRRRNRLLTPAYTAMAANSTTREMRVARAAPSTSRRGAPRFPKISTQLSAVLVHMDMVNTTSPRRGFPMLRWAPT